MHREVGAHAPFSCEACVCVKHRRAATCICEQPSSLQNVRRYVASLVITVTNILAEGTAAAVTAASTAAAVVFTSR